MRIPHLCTALLIALLLSPAGSDARNDLQSWPIDEAMNSLEFRSRLGDFRFVWGTVEDGERVGATSSRRATNGINKSDRRACEWALLSALIALRDDALRRGGTSVQGIVSVVSGAPFESTTHFQCRSGFTNSRVALDAAVMR